MTALTEKELDALVKRLRDEPLFICDGEDTTDIGVEAADAITALRAELAAERADVEAFQRIVDARVHYIAAVDAYNAKRIEVNDARAKGYWGGDGLSQNYRDMEDTRSNFIGAAEDEADAAIASTKEATK